MKKRWMSNLVELARRLQDGLGSIFICALLVVLLSVVPVAAQEDSLRETAESFLELLDGGSYQQAWWEGSELLHMTSSLDQWVDEVRVRRELFGEFKERSVKSGVSRTSLSGFPDGDFEILLFDSRFENKQKGLEMLVFVKSPYGDWKLVSYRLR